MSRWFPESLKVRLSAEALEFELLGPKQARSWSRSLVAAEAGQLSAQSVCGMLDQELRTLAAIELRFEVILQSSWVRYCLIPWNSDFTSPADRASFVQHCFNDMYGEMTARWTARSSYPVYGHTALGAAIDSELLGELTRIGQQSRCKLIGVRPQLTERMEQARRGIKDHTFWFVLCDPSHYTMLLMHAGAPAAVQVVGRREGSLDNLLERAWRASGLELERCRVFVDSGPSSTVDLGNSRLGWNIERIPAMVPAQHGRATRNLSKVAS